jgi:hypothetical protein
MSHIPSSSGIQTGKVSKVIKDWNIKDMALDSDDDDDVAGKNKIPLDLKMSSIEDQLKYHKSNPNKEYREAKISNANIMMAIRSLEQRVKTIEDALGGIVNLLNEIKQSTPTFVSSGNSGPLMKKKDNPDTAFAHI